MLYQDCFEVCNPLGSAKTKHKIFALYFIIGNLLEHNKSKINNIQVSILCKEKYIKQFGRGKIFSLLIADLKKIETDGITIVHQNHKKQIFGTVIGISGDNLGSHFIGGFVENFSRVEYICRYCYLKKSDLQNPDCCNEMRTKSSYNEDLLDITDDNPTVRGLKLNSEFNTLKYFHVCNPGLPPCAAHDLFEGVVQYDLLLIIKHFVQENYISYKILNNKLQNVNFDTVNCHTIMPYIKKSDNKINGQALQILRLLQVLSLLMINLVNTDDLVWNMFLILKQFCDLLIAPKLSQKQTFLIDILWMKYLRYRQQLFSDIPLRPKHHYVTHYGYLTRNFGPLIRFWTMRFESKHQYFKKMVKHIPNFKNVTQSMAERHQLLQSYLFANSIYADIVIAKGITPVVENLVNHTIIKCLNSIPFHLKNNLLLCNSVQYRGKIYGKDMILALKICDNGYVEVLKILYILTTKTKKHLFFIGEQMHMIYIDFLGLYQLKKESILIHKCVSYEYLLDYDPLTIHKFDEAYVLPKHAFMDML